MKIYPSTDTIQITKEVNQYTDIPLCYIDSTEIDYNIEMIINESFKKESKKEIFPYSIFNEIKYILFNDNNDAIDIKDTSLCFKKLKDKYQYIPTNSVSFTPAIFDYSVLLKAQNFYSSHKDYNIKINTKDDIIVDDLMQIFGDAPFRYLAPSNIYINNMDLSSEQLKNDNNNDFYICTISNPIDIDNVKNNLINKNTNIIAFVKDEYAFSQEQGNIKMNNNILNKKYYINIPTIYNSIEYDYDFGFNIPENNDKNTYHNIFNSNSITPILIEEYIDENFVIYIPESILKNIKFYNKIFYEVLMYVYLKSYITINSNTLWIADKMPDYVVENNMLVKKENFCDDINKYKITDRLKNTSILKVIINKDKYDFVDYLYEKNDILYFKKNILTDPIKDEDSISIFTENKDIVYIKNFAYTIDENLEKLIDLNKDNNKVTINIKSFKNSSNNIYVKFDNEFTINLIEQINNKNIYIEKDEYHIVIKQLDSLSYFELIKSENYTPSHGLIAATIYINQNKNKNNLYDMRIRGGGLPDTYEDNYDCFDIGHINGRPYRRGASLIFTLPKKLEKYKDIIESTIKQYCVAEEFPVILFEEV